MAETDSKPLGGDSNKFPGEYIGKVEDVDDPKKLLRVRVRVFSVFTDDVPVSDLPWAEYRLPVGSRFNDGFFIPADVGDLVWVKFPYEGDTRRPVIIGSAHYAPNGKPNFPHEAWEGISCHQHKRTGEEPYPMEKIKNVNGVNIKVHTYHSDVIFTQHGITMEMRNDNSFSVIQRDTGTEIYIHQNGDAVVHVEGTLYGSATLDCLLNIGRDAEVVAGGDISAKAGANAEIRASGWGQLVADGEVLVKSHTRLTLKGPSGVIIL